MEAASLEGAGKRLHELATAAGAVGFEMSGARVEVPSPDEPEEGVGWTGYAPTT
jgi:hypothetical protein